MMISDEVLIQTILIGVLAGVLAVGVQRLMFKKSIVFFIAAIVVVPIVVGCGVGLVLGARGVHHFVWAAPVVVVVTVVGLEIIARILRKPLNEMIKTVDSLSQGNVDISFDEKFKKGGHELARVMRRVAKLTESLKNIAIFANHVGKGDLNVEYTLLGENDILGKAMLDMRANLQQAESEKEERHKEDERRNWVTQGVAKFAELLRANHNNLEELCQSIVSNLVKYIGANQAGIFILNDEDEQNPVLELKACYAYERRKYLQKTIGVGEGLVGTCFLERQSIYMNDIPKDYIRITSGLGGETPSALLITPLRVNEDVYGIVEIAAFKAFEVYERDFVEKVAESIASTVASVKVSMRTNNLLAQTKLQAEEMANQEEELRQNMEEMQATQEEMSLKNQDAERANQELAKTMAENEYQLSKLDLVVQASKIGLWDMEIVKGDPVNPANSFTWSDEFRKMLGYSSVFDFPNVLNSWSEKLHPEDKEQTLDLFAKHLLDRTGRTPYDLEYRLLKKNGEYGHYHAFGETTRDEEGYALRVAGAIQDITEEKTGRDFELKQLNDLILETLNVVEFSADGTLTDINQNLLNLWEADKTVFVGKHYSELVGEEACQTVWKDMVKGKPHKDVRPVTTLQGKTMIFRHNFMPICDKDGRLMRVVLLAFLENG